MSESTIPAAPCCSNPDPESTNPCALCQKPTCKNCRSIVDRRRVCPDCRARIESELEAEKAAVPGLPIAVAGGAIGAIAGAVLWAAVAILTRLNVGYVAVAVGWCAATGVILGAGRKKGRPLQIVAIFCAVAGLFLGKYLAVAYFTVQHAAPGAGLSYLDPRIFSYFVHHLDRYVGGFDALWLFLALGVAWKLPRKTMVRMSRSPGVRARAG